MKTSNPNSYAQRAHKYARDVVAGKILSSKWIIFAAQRHLDDLKRNDSRWHYDEQKVNRVCAFIESLQLTESSKFIMRDFQIWLVANLMGWVDDAGTRKHIEALILIPKGNGKSPLAAALGLWFAFLDGRTKAEVFCGAMNLKQAKEVFAPAIAFVDSQPAFARLGVVAQKTSIYSTRSGSVFQPVIGKGRHGARPYLAILDELHQAISADLYDTFKTGCNKTPNSLLLTISTAGVASLENPCYALQTEAEKILQGIIENDRIFAAIYAADDTVEWDSEEALLMANPNLGISNDGEKIRIAQLEAVRNPAKQNITKAMHLNIWSTAASAWMNIQAWGKCFDPLLTLESVQDLPGWLGSDLASKLDLSATVKLFRRDDLGDKPHYYCFVNCYLPEDRVNAPENQHYQKWVNQEHLIATPGSSIDYATLEADSVADVATYQIQELAYDARYADQYAQRVADISGCTRVETPPSPAVLSPAMKELEAAVYDGRFHHNGHPVLTWCMSNVLTRESAAGGNYSMPSKSRPENKIDAAVALFIAMARARLHVSNLNDSASNYVMFA
jgi:phage terminase large subunit-like protein